MRPADSQNQSRSAVVTGAAGFLGSHVVRALGRARFRVRALLGPAPGPDQIPLWHDENRVEADITDAATLGRLVRDANVVVHLAGPPSVADSFSHPEHFIRVHTLGTAAVLEACRAAAIERVVYVSSAEVYGRAQTKFVAEHHPLEPRSPYAAAKVGAEALARVYADVLGLSVVILRPFSVYGPGAPRLSLLSELTAKILAGKPPSVRDLRPVRDYVFVEDVADAVVAACLRRERDMLVCNVGTMCGTSVAEVATMLLHVFGSRSRVHEERTSRRPERSEVSRLVADNQCARTHLGWSPRIMLEEGLTRLAEAHLA